MAINNGQDLNQNVIRKPATIANGGTISSNIFVGGQMIVGLDCGPALTGTTMGFLNSIDGGKTFRVVEDEAGDPISVSASADTYVNINPPITGLDIIRLVSGAAEAANRNLILVLIP